MKNNYSFAFELAKRRKMVSTSKSPHTKQCQFEVMVEFMTRHPDLAKGFLKTPDAKTKSQNLSKRLESDLNMLGPPVRDVAGWKRVWSDHKTYLKGKLRKNKQNFTGTGGGPPNICSTTELEERAIALLNMREAVKGLSANKFGINNAPTNFSTADHNILEDEVLLETVDDELGAEQQVHLTLEQPQCSTTSRPFTPCPPTPNRRVVSERQLLNRQVDNQIQYQEKMVKAMSDVNDNLKSLVRHSRRKLELKEKKMKLEEKKFEHKKKIDLENQRIKRAKLDVKEKMLALHTSISS